MEQITEVPIIVTGTGRCGTSFVTKTLATHFDICMGHDLNTKPSKYHKVGHWELKPRFFKAKDIKTTNLDLVIKDFKAHIGKCTCENKLHGIKAPFLSQLTKAQWEQLRDIFGIKLLIWPWRPAEAVIYSRTYKYRRREDVPESKRLEAIEWAYGGLIAMEKAFSKPPFDVVQIDFTTEVPEEKVIQFLNPFITKLKRIYNVTV